MMAKKTAKKQAAKKKTAGKKPSRNNTAAKKPVKRAKKTVKPRRDEGEPDVLAPVFFRDDGA
jgi:hypothetical protein